MAEAGFTRKENMMKWNFKQLKIDLMMPNRNTGPVRQAKASYSESRYKFLVTIITVVTSMLATVSQVSMQGSMETEVCISLLTNTIFMIIPHFFCQNVTHFDAGVIISKDLNLYKPT